MSDISKTVYIVDDDEAVRDALSMLVESVDLEPIAFSSALEFIEQYDDSFAGCLVLDIRMPGMSGLQLQEELKAKNSPLPIIFITGHGDIPMAVQAVKAGAIDFVSKPFRDQELLDCIQKALTDFSRNHQQHKERQTLASRLSTLTPREREVLHKMVEGKANKVIAAELNLSQRTVEVHRAHVMEKMETRSLAEIVRVMAALESS